MFCRVSIASLTAVVLALGLVTQPAAAPPTPIQAPAPGPTRAPGAPTAPAMVKPPAAAPVPQQTILKLEQLTKQQFDALPAGHAIEVGGQRTTKGEFLARMERERTAALARMRAKTSQALARFEAKRAQLLQQQKAEIDAHNQKVRAAFAAHRTQRGGLVRSAAHEAIRQEARELLERSKTASPAEQAQIEQRAGELLKRLQQVPR